MEKGRSCCIWNSRTYKTKRKPDPAREICVGEVGSPRCGDAGLPDPVMVLW